VEAAVLDRAGSKLVVRNVATPDAGVGQVLVRIRACGICYTDLKMVDGFASSQPCILGHEPVGEIVDVGRDVIDRRLGERVAVHAFFSCGACPACEAGEEEACILGMKALAGLGCDGGYAEYLAVPAQHAVPLPNALPYAEAAPLLCAGLTTYAAFRNGGLRPSQKAVVVGIGGLGHLALSIGAAMGARMYAVTTSPDKSADAQRRGAIFAGSPSEVLERVNDDGGADLVLNTVDDLASVSQLVPGMAKQGTIVLAAGRGEALPISVADLMGLQLRVVGTFFGSARDVSDLLALAVEHDIRPQIERYPLSEVNEAHDRLRANAVRYRAVLEI
jgi:D-arabinose 1-dehydrogenase-like Zn-dependent alcohol dehydrogenase